MNSLSLNYVEGRWQKKGEEQTAAPGVTQTGTQALATQLGLSGQGPLLCPSWGVGPSWKNRTITGTA